MQQQVSERVKLHYETMIPNTRNTTEIQQSELVSFFLQRFLYCSRQPSKRPTSNNASIHKIIYVVAMVSTLRALLIHTSNEIVGKQTDLARDPRSLASIRHLLIEQQFFPRKDIKSLSGGYQNLQLK